MRDTSTASMSSTSITACGLPIDAAPKATSPMPSTGSVYSGSGDSTPAIGMRAGTNSGTPIAMR